MAELKTKETGASVEAFLRSVPDAERRRDCRAVVDLMRRATRAEPRMWGPSIVGFGRRHYRYESGREGDWFVAGFSPRKANLTLYLTSYFDGRDALIRKLGKCKAGRACLYINRLADVDLDVLEKLVRQSVKNAGRQSD